MDFKEFKTLLQENFKQLTKEVDYLFEVDVDKDELWNLYLDSFPEGTNEIYRERREHDCSCCRQFIKNIGNAVVIKDNKIKTIWDFTTNDTTYQPVINALSNYIKSCVVSIEHLQDQQEGLEYEMSYIENLIEEIKKTTILFSGV